MRCARPRGWTPRSPRSAAAAVRPADQPVLPQGPARELRQARADADAGADQHRRRDAAGLGRSRYWDENLLQGPPPVRAVPAGRRHHRPPDVRARGPTSWRAGIASAARKVVLGGLHVLSCPDEVRAARRRAGDRRGRAALAARSCATSRRARSQPVYRGELPPALSRRPARRAATCCRAGSFLTTTSLIATRGCHNRCGFCYLATEGLHMPYQMRDVEQVVAEFRGRRPALRASSSTTTSARGPTTCGALCRALRPLEKIWSAAVTIDVTDDPALVREMALAGCTGVFVGFESLHGREPRRRAQEDARAPTDYARRVALLHDHGIQVNGSFVLGFDHDRPDVFERTVDWIEENRLECATFHILTPYPGTPLFRQMEARGPAAAPGLVALRHGARRLPAAAHDARRSWRRATPGATGGCSRTRSIWRRRPADWRGGARRTWRCRYLYKRSNRLWHLLIRHRLTGAGLAAAGGVDAAAAPAVPPPAGGRSDHRHSGNGRGGHVRGGANAANTPADTSITFGKCRSVPR